MASSGRYATNGPTRLYNLSTKDPYNGYAVNGVLCASGSADLYDATDQNSPRVPVSLSVCEDAPPATIPLSVKATIIKWLPNTSLVEIQLEGAPQGATMDGVYIIGLLPECDPTGQRRRFKPLYTGDFWTESDLRSTYWFDIDRPYTAPHTGVRVSTRVIDSTGKVIKEIDSSACLTK